MEPGSGGGGIVKLVLCMIVTEKEIKELEIDTGKEKFLSEESKVTP